MGEQGVKESGYVICGKRGYGARTVFALAQTTMVSGTNTVTKKFLWKKREDKKNVSDDTDVQVQGKEKSKQMIKEVRSNFQELQEIKKNMVMDLQKRSKQT